MIESQRIGLVKFSPIQIYLIQLIKDIDEWLLIKINFEVTITQFY